MEIQQEHFEAWLFAQPNSRRWDYCDGQNCVIASFIKETTAITEPLVNSKEWWMDIKDLYVKDGFPIPLWLYNTLVSGSTIIQATHLKARYRQLFPDTPESVDITNPGGDNLQVPREAQERTINENH